MVFLYWWAGRGRQDWKSPAESMLCGVVNPALLDLFHATVNLLISLVSSSVNLCLMGVHLGALKIISVKPFRMGLGLSKCLAQASNCLLCVTVLVR